MCPDSGLLKVHATGKFSLEEAQRTFLEMMEAVALHRTERVLFDGRTIQGNPRTMERFYYGEFAAETVAQYRERGVSPGTRFAYVLKEPVLDPHRFGETVAVNRWMRLKVFDSLEEALEWLAPGSANKPAAAGRQRARLSQMSRGRHGD
jgi:hypothetical protein